MGTAETHATLRTGHKTRETKKTRNTDPTKKLWLNPGRTKLLISELNLVYNNIFCKHISRLIKYMLSSFRSQIRFSFFCHTLDNTQDVSSRQSIMLLRFNFHIRNTIQDI